MWFDIGSQQGAGARTRLKSSIKKFEPHFIYDFFLFSLLFLFSKVLHQLVAGHRRTYLVAIYAFF